MRAKILILLCIAALLSCSSDDVPVNTLPSLNIGKATDVTRTEATLTGSVSDAQSASDFNFSFCYGTDSKMEQSLDATLDGTALSVKLTGLTPGTQYFYALEASNGRLTLNSSTSEFTTEHNLSPTLTAPVRLSYGPTSILLCYEVSDDGGDDLTATGIYVVDAASQDTTIVSADPLAGAQTYRVRVGNLRREWTYSFTAFATNRNGETRSTPLTHTTGNAVMLENAGDLTELIGDERYSYTSLSIIGPLNGDDIRCLRDMMGRDVNGYSTAGQLSDLDLTDASIVYGGGTYDMEHFTVDNCVSMGMFANLDKLEKILLPDQTTTIEHEAFANSTALRQIDVPASVSSLLPSNGCTALEAINASAASPYYQSVDGVLFNADATAIVWFPIAKTGSYTLPESVSEIADYAFQGCLLSQIQMPSGLVEMGQGVFFESALQIVVMPAKLKTVPTATFQHCYQLKTVTLGESTELLSDYVFDGCPITDLYIEAEYPPVCYSNTFTTSVSDFFDTCTIHVPQGSKSLYRNHKYWGQFKHITE